MDVNGQADDSVLKVWVEVAAGELKHQNQLDPVVSSSRSGINVLRFGRKKDSVGCPTSMRVCANAR